MSGSLVTFSARCRSRSECSIPAASAQWNRRVCSGSICTTTRTSQPPRRTLRSAYVSSRTTGWTGPRGLQAHAATPGPLQGDRPRPSPRRFVRSPATIPRSARPYPIHMAPAGRARRCGQVVGPAAGPQRPPRCSCRERQDRRAAAATTRGGASRHRDRAAGRGVRHGDRRRRACRSAAAEPHGVSEGFVRS